jgi:hypothetical protein
MTDDPAPSPETPTPAAAPPAATGKIQKESIWEVYYPFNADQDKDAVPVASFPMIIYFWPTLLAFLICGILQSLGGDGAQSVTLGWWATAALTFNLMVIVTDLDQKKFAIVVLLVLLACAGLYVGSMKGWAVLGSSAEWISSLQVSYSTAAYLVVGGSLLFFFLLGMLQPRLNYWRLEPNEFVHYVQPWGRDQSIPRLGSTVSREVPDILELILTFGGGTLVIKREGQVVARIEHVPFLGKRMHSIERLLGVTRVQQT